ncbi:MAG: S41 family peptidase [Candidatus Omnitrophica bacterium]|nr:S41 family peptidase [Candidatus Omnitrophota bacterium]
MFRKFILLLVLAAGVVVCANFALSATSKSAESAESKDAVTSAMANEADAADTKNAVKAEDKDLYAQVELFSYALSTVQSEYVVEKTPKDLIYGALEGMVGGLDPHSQFLSPDDYQDLKTDTEGKFGGLGIEISIRDGLLTVVTPIEDTPAWKAGLKPGDRIVKIEKVLTRDMKLSDAVKKLRGAPGTKVHITILREAEFKVNEVEITREIIHVQDIKDAHILEDGIGYVRLVEFRENSYEEMHKALLKLKADGATALVLDLRNNPGGLLNVAIKISEMFLPEGKTIVSTKGRHPEQDSIAISHNAANEFGAWPIVALINEGSASGSEILAGALKDNKRAVTLGAKSFGKGSVQSVIPMPDGSGLRLTTSKYFTPSGVCIHEIGITPDIVIERIYPEEEELAEGGSGVKDLKKNKKKESKEAQDVFDKLELEGVKDPVELEKHKKESDLKKRMGDDNQIQSAINVIKGIRVYKRLQTEEGPSVAKK